MNANLLFEKVEELSRFLESKDLDKATLLDNELINFLGKEGRVVPRIDAPPRLQISYAYNRSILRMYRDKIEEAVLAMIDVAEIIRFYELWDDIYFILYLLAESIGKHDKFDNTLAYAFDILMMAVVSQIKFPALSLSLFWKAESLFTQLKRNNINDFIKGLIKLQYDLIAVKYKSDDLNGSEIFNDKANNILNIKMRIPTDDEPKYTTDNIKEYEIQPDIYKDFFKDSNEHIPSLNEWELFWKNFPDYKLSESLTVKKYGNVSLMDKNKLPNLLEVIETLCYDEEKYALIYDKSPFGITNPYHEKWYDIDTLRNCNDKLIFLPRHKVKNWYYRGQTKYFKYCKPSLYRDTNKNRNKYSVFVERLKLCEFSIIIHTLPVSNILKSGFVIPTRSGEFLHHFVHIDDMALAQHYGIKTECLDLSTDKWIAAFFASCEHVEGAEQYSNYKPHNGNDVGVFYIYQNKSSYGNNFNMHPVGIQPFARPVKQAGYVMEIGSNQNFDKIAKGIYFKHESRCSEIIFKLFNDSKVIMPHEIIESKAKIIANSTKFSIKALDNTRERFYSHLDEYQFKELLTGSQVEIVNESIVDFLYEEIEKTYQEFDLINKHVQFSCLMRLFMSFPIN